MFKLGPVNYEITNKDIDICQTSSGYSVSVSVTARNETVDPDIGEISLTFEGTIENLNSVTENIAGLLFVAEFIDCSGTLEVLEDTIHFYGTTDVNWNEELGKNVEFDIEIRRNKYGTFIH